MKNARRRKLSQFMPNHILGDEYRDELLAIVNRKRMSYELGHYRRSTGPCADDSLLIYLIQLLDLLPQMLIDERSLLDRSRHLNLQPVDSLVSLISIYFRLRLLTMYLSLGFACRVL